MKETLDSEGDSEDDEDPFESSGSEYSPEADDPGVFWCPNCGGGMFGDATRCPTCGDFVTPGARPSTPTPWWIWVVGGLIALAFLAGLAASALR